MLHTATRLHGSACAHACSLRADVDRLAFSVLWEMTPEADVVKTEFTKSIIRSSAALTYEEAQNRINDDSRSDTVTLSLRQLLRVSRILRGRRRAPPPPHAFVRLCRRGVMFAAVAVGASAPAMCTRARPRHRRCSTVVAGT